MMFMVIETSLDGPDPVYVRAAMQGRLLPHGVEYVDSWVEEPARNRCFQLMRTTERSLLDLWTERWSDIVSFEIVEVALSADVSNTYGS